MNSENVRTRNLKVSYGHYRYTGGFFHPLICLRGKYLLQFGFNVGDMVKVSLSEGHITIKKVSKDAP